MKTTGTGTWTRSPKHILRAAAVHDATRDWAPGQIVEFGAGRAAITRLFLDRGFSAVLYDLGDETRADLHAAFAGNSAVTVVNQPEQIANGSADYLMAFEVLEHIRDDADVLAQWANKVRPGGKLLVTVPAHMRKFSDTDRRVGHVRRYEREELHALLDGAGFADISINNYGFPLGNLSRRVMSRLESTDTDTPVDDVQVDRSIRSGIEQPTAVNRLSRIVSPTTLKPFTMAQRAFYAKDRGDGYVATAVRQR